MNSCIFFMDYKQRPCDSLIFLHHIFFRNPDSINESKEITLCKRHYDEVILELLHEIIVLERKRDNYYARMQREKQICKEQDMFYNYDEKKNKLDDLQININKMKNEQCMNNFCKKNLQDVFGKIYSAVIYGSRGFVGRKLNFCSRDCWLKILARCGYKIAFVHGPLPITLDNFKENK